MSSKEQAPIIPHDRFRFSLKVTSLMVLPPYKGGVFRGAFGAAFRRVVCAARSTDCTDCLLATKCLYAALFEPLPPPDHPEAGKYTHVPSPFVLNPPLTNQQAFHPYDRMDCDLVLMGPSLEALPYFVYTFMEMGKRGLGKERGRYELLKVDLIRGDEITQVYDGDTQTIHAYPPKGDGPGFEKKGQIKALTLNFLTPLRLKVKGSLVTELSFSLFFERLTHRLGLLASFYGGDSARPNFASLVSKAKDVRTTSNDLHWYEWERYSGRQKAAMKLGGLRGKLQLEGDLHPFVPILRMGEQVNVGQGTSFGLGRYEVAVSPGNNIQHLLDRISF